MKYYYHGGFKDKFEYFDFLKVIENANTGKNYGLHPNLPKKEYKPLAETRFLEFLNDNGGTIRYEGLPTRVQMLEEARDAFVHKDSHTPVYHIVKRVKNIKGETVEFEFTKTSKKTQFRQYLLGMIRTYKIKFRL